MQQPFSGAKIVGMHMCESGENERGDPCASTIRCKAIPLAAGLCGMEKRGVSCVLKRGILAVCEDCDAVARNGNLGGDYGVGC